MECGERIFRKFDVDDITEPALRRKARELRDWLRKARPGEKFVYHVGPTGTLPAPLARYVATLAEDERIHVLHYPVPVAGPSTGARIYEYTAIPMSDRWRQVIHRVLPVEV